MWPAILAGLASLGLSLSAARSAKALKAHRRQYEWIERSVARLTGEWVGSGDWGEEFRDPDHPFAEDLDLLGEGSLFELLAPPSFTVVGRSALADWLLKPCSAQSAVQRQEAIAELCNRVDLQLELCQVADALMPDPGGTESLREWAARKQEETPWWYRLGLLGFVISLVLVGALGAGGALPATQMLIVVGALGVPQLLLCWKVRESIKRTADAIASNSRALRELEKGARLMERERFRSPLLCSMRQVLRPGSTNSASTLLASLNRRFAWFQARNSDILLVGSYLLAWATQWGLSIESWQIAHGSELVGWADAVGSFEGLCALAAFASDHPRGVFPSYQPGSQVTLAADDMQHPFLRDGHAVGNSVRLDAASRVLAITGSNMSGKSTYLRAVGLNYVLARAGAPVRASRLELSEFSLVASARIDESLHQRRSRFLAEASKLSSALETGGGSKPVLLLADEVLSGTNSRDRRVGARAVVEQLIKRGGSTLLTTHDVELAETLSEIPAARTAHFRDEVVDGELEFDYRLRPGVVRCSNALLWLRTLGVDV